MADSVFVPMPSGPATLRQVVADEILLFGKRAASAPAGRCHP
ncbi:hypothetical protein P3W85_12780 [Cupriavidus basilensis]|uniref:Uncharacterized protein n=1 Tax=Cupriavidus basilensis TaxID=68895 RepID=A0ABT6AQ01_9BURK|nr:hypothetical protein [Cupriavidus basilensis]MDF3833816.1 hypothetical protein [Cupriavidus basilensis]